MTDLDPRTAGLEAQLDRLDEARSDGDDGPATTTDRGDFDADADGFGFHLDDPDEPPADAHDDELEEHEGTGIAVEVLDALIVAFNHRDLEDLLEIVASDGEAPGLLGYDRDNLPDAIADLWSRRPSVQLTRGALDDVPVGVLWEHDGAAWWQLAVVSVDDVSAEVVGVLEFADDPDLLDRVRTSEPDEDLLEGERWQEWDEGSQE